MRRYVILVVLLAFATWLVWWIGEKHPWAIAPPSAMQQELARADRESSTASGGAPAPPPEMTSSPPSKASGKKLVGPGLSQPFRTREAVPPPPTGIILTADNSEQTRPMANNASILPDVADLARQLNGPGNTPQDDLALIQSLLGIYRKANNDMNPEGGLNYEITSAMLGDNKSRYAVLPVDLPAVSEGGELVDRWGTPYWFHPISNHLMDVRSAGPDHELWTDDDVSIPYAYHQ